MLNQDHAPASRSVRGRCKEHVMPGRGRPTFNKRQKEQKRTEKRREKEAKRAERKLTSQPLTSEEMIAAEALAMAEAAAMAEEEGEALPPHGQL
jgi:hypothetical protein